MSEFHSLSLSVKAKTKFDRGCRSFIRNCASKMFWNNVLKVKHCYEIYFLFCFVFINSLFYTILGSILLGFILLCSILLSSILLSSILLGSIILDCILLSSILLSSMLSCSILLSSILTIQSSILLVYKPIFHTTTTKRESRPKVYK